MGNCQPQAIDVDAFAMMESPRQFHKSSGGSHPQKCSSESPTRPYTRRFRTYNHKLTSSSTSTFASSSMFTLQSSGLTVREVTADLSDEEVPDAVVEVNPDSHNPAQARDGPPRTQSIPTAPCILTPSCPQELGKIRFHFTDMSSTSSSEAWKEEARRCQRPLLRFEISVPGDERIGREVLSHPLIAEASETLFISVLSHSRTHGSHGKPNPHEPRNYVRISVVETAADTTPDMHVTKSVSGDDLSVADVAGLMVEALQCTQRPIPPYLSLLHEEESAQRMIDCGTCLLPCDRRAVFAVSCCTRGEVEFGSLQGVVATRSGHCEHHKKLIEVTYDSSRLVYGRLVRYAMLKKLATSVFYQSNDERIASLVEVRRAGVHWKTELLEWSGDLQPSIDPKHALRTTLLKYVPLTPLQSLRANHMVHNGRFHEAMRLLSPRQGMIMMRTIQCGSRSKKGHRPEFVDVPFVAAWKKVSQEEQEKAGGKSANEIAQERAPVRSELSTDA